MDSVEALRVLLAHAGDSFEGVRAVPLREDGFLPCLRPYRGLREQNFHEVMEALLVLGEEWHRSEQVDRRVVGALWSMCCLARLWGIHPDGMLRRNKLIAVEDVHRLERWIDVIEWSAWHVLHGTSPMLEVERYCDYVADYQAGDNVAFFVGLMIKNLEDPRLSDPSCVAKALGKLGAAGRAALPALKALAGRKFSDWAEPEASEAVAEAIRRIVAA